MIPYSFAVIYTALENYLRPSNSVGGALDKILVANVQTKFKEHISCLCHFFSKKVSPFRTMTYIFVPHNKIVINNIAVPDSKIAKIGTQSDGMSS